MLPEHQQALVAAFVLVLGFVLGWSIFGWAAR